MKYSKTIVKADEKTAYLTDKEAIQNFTKNMEVDGLGDVVKPWKGGEWAQLYDHAVTINDKDDKILVDVYFNGMERIVRVYNYKSKRKMDPQVDGAEGDEYRF